MKKCIAAVLTGSMMISGVNVMAETKSNVVTCGMWSCTGNAEPGSYVTGVLTIGNRPSGDYGDVLAMADTYADENGDYVINVNIPPGKIEDGDAVTALIHSDGKSETKTMYYEEFNTSGMSTAEKYGVMRSKLEKLKKLISGCEASGIQVDYEKINCAVIEKFIGYGLEDLNGGNEERSEYVLAEIEKLYGEAVAALTSYENGEAKPIKITRNDLDIIPQFEGMSVTADDKPVFLTGFLGQDYMISDMASFADMGFNSVSLEIGVSDVIVDPENSVYGGWKTQYYNGVNTGNTSMKIESGKGVSGSKAFRLTNTAEKADHRYIVIEQTVPVEPNTAYEFGASVRTISGSGVKIYGGGWNGENFYIANKLSSFVNDNRSFNTGNTNYATIWILSDSPGENIIDNIYMRKVGTLDNIVQNGNFETELEVVDGLGIDRGAIGTLKRDMEKARKNGLSVNLLISPHYFPGFVLNESSDYVRENGSVEWYKGRIRQSLELYIDALINEVKEYPQLYGICLTNEPMFNLMDSPESFARPFWTEYLSEKYGNISTLNSKWGTYYTSFEKVKIPSGIESTHYAYEWELMNRELFAEWHGSMAKQIKEIAPHLAIHAKEINYLSSRDTDYERMFLTAGTDARLFSDFSDVHGCDAHGYLEETHVYQLQNKFQWYDYLTTIEEKTIFNSEDHVIMDGSQIYSENQAKHVYTDMFQGAIHGRGISNIWVYGRTQESGNAWSDSIMHRPDVMKATGRASLDINRLADEITALQNKDAEIAIVFSDASRRYDRNHMNALYQSYKAAIYSGFRVAVVDEQSILEGKADKCQAIILPNVKYLSEDAINKLASSGAKKIIIGDNCAKYDCYKRTHKSSITTSLTNGATVINANFSNYAMTSPSVSQIQNTIQSNTKNNVSIKSGGTAVTDTEYRAVPYKNGWLVNMCSYDFDNEKNVEIYIDGEKISEFKDLKDDVVKDKLTLNGYEPELIYVDMSKVRLSEKNGVVTAKNSTSGNITGAYMVNAGYDSTGKMETCQLIPLDIDENGETEKAVQLDSTVHRIFVLESLDTLTSCSEVLEIN